MDCRGQEETLTSPSAPHKEEVMGLLPPMTGIPVVLPVELSGAQAPVPTHLLLKLKENRGPFWPSPSHHCHLTNWLHRPGLGV